MAGVSKNSIDKGIAFNALEIYAKQKVPHGVCDPDATPTPTGVEFLTILNIATAESSPAFLMIVALINTLLDANSWRDANSHTSGNPSTI